MAVILSGITYECKLSLTTMTTKAHKPRRVSVPPQNESAAEGRRIAVSAFAARLRQAISGRSITALAQKLGVSRTAVHDWIAGRATPDVITISRLASVIGVSMEWLTAGRGEIQAGRAQGYIAPAWPGDRAPVLFELDWFRKNFGEIVVPDEIRKGIAPQEPEQFAAPHLFEISDDSMEPGIRKGDLLLARHGAAADYQTNGLYLIARKRAKPGEQRLFPRRVEWSANSAIIKCDNPAYPDAIKISERNDQGLVIMARVVWHGRIV